MKSTVICHDYEGREYPVPPDKLLFRPSVYGLLFEGNKVLLSKQWDGYDFPGGGVDIDESLEEGVVREFFEETGLKIKPLYVFHAGSSFFKPTMRREELYWNCQMIYFLVNKCGGELSKDNCDKWEKDFMGMPEWIDIDELESCKFYNHLGQKSVELIKRGWAIKEKFPDRPSDIII